ncbi:hypothetical protein [Sorangium cellulosum]|uniref:Uncharacterized protein n=2 Tax=Sorangium cellulosum TaxID=56 RepID=A0A150TL45_SORCE|nr:hypothetical protein [Sorangium cellulosum]AGP35984.1 hypothetical protein SCE1572_16630 [Sorangium cellulosum So0157-2]KYG05433.1 hypothetical protein BE21_40725 [Sorangium cellulosum]
MRAPASSPEAEFLEQIGNVLPRYDAMVRDKLQKEAAATSNLATHVRAIQTAIVNYATKVAAMVDEEAAEQLHPLVERLSAIRWSRCPGTTGKGKVSYARHRRTC